MTQTNRKYYPNTGRYELKTCTPDCRYMFNVGRIPGRPTMERIESHSADCKTPPPRENGAV